LIDKKQTINIINFKLTRMKKSFSCFMSLMLFSLFALTAQAETITPYNVDFNTAIDTEDHAFKVASNWGHIVGFVSDYSDVYYMSYSYNNNKGVDGTGSLQAYKQEAGDSYYSKETVYDLLVTPVISGTVSIKAKAVSSYASQAFVEFYTLNETATAKNTLIQKFTTTNGVGTDEYVPVSITLDTPQRIGIRIQYVNIDDFSATSAEIVPEKGLKLISADGLSSSPTGSSYWFIGEDGKVTMEIKNIVVQNTGDCALNVGDTGFSVAICDKSNKTIYSNTVNVPQDLAIGASSDPFDAVFTVDPVAISWSFGKYLSLIENINGTQLHMPYAYTVAYEPKFVFRNAGTTSTSNVSGTQSFGMHYSDQVADVAPKAFEIYNDGGAPLVIKSISIDGGFGLTVTYKDAAVGTGEFNIARREFASVSVAMPTEIDSYIGNLSIVYVDKTGAEQTYELPFSANIVKAGTFNALFDNTSSEAAWPQGSAAEKGVQTGYIYRSGAELPYDNYLTSYESDSYKDANNKFITPKLHAAEGGESMTFDICRNTESVNTLKVYISADRINWGEPVMSLTRDDLSRNYLTKSINVPEGDWYIAFAIFNTELDNIIGLTKVDVAHDVYVSEIKQQDEIQSGVAKDISLKINALTNEPENGYTLKFVAEPETGDAQSVDFNVKELTAHAYKTVEFKVNWAPVVETTTTFNTYFLFTYSDGETIRIDSKPMKVTNEADFLIVKKDDFINLNYRPDNYKGTVNFGKINISGTSKAFDIANYGTAELKVKSITVPEGFSVDVEAPFTVTSKTTDGVTRKTVNVAVSATEPGLYQGNVVFTYEGGNGADATFELPVVVTFLDPNKWYASFDDGTSNGAWPAGVVYADGMQLNNNDYNNPNCAAITYNNSFFFTPMLTAAENEELRFDVKSYNDYSERSVKVYAVKDRDDVIDVTKRGQLTALATLTNKAEELPESSINSSEFKTFAVTAPEAGDWYFAFVLSGTQIDDIVGMEPATLASDLLVKSVSIPSTGMQNVVNNIKIDVLNFAAEALAAEEYTLQVYLDGAMIAENVGTSEVPASNSLKDTPVTLLASYRTPLIGEHEIYAQIVVGEDIYKTESATVNFTKEVASAEIVVGVYGSTDKNKLINLNYNNSESLTLYTPAELGLSGGEKISSIRLRGYQGADDKKITTTNLVICYQWVDNSTLDVPAAKKYDISNMIQLRSGEYEFPQAGTSSEFADLITLTPTEPIVYPAGKSLLFYTFNYTSSFISNRPNWELTASGFKNTVYRQKDGSEASQESTTWSTNYQCAPVLHLDLLVENATVTGSVVTAAGDGVADANVVLISEDGDNVQYSTVADAQGDFTVDVIQSDRVYTVKATSGSLTGEVSNVNPKDNAPVEVVLAEMVVLNKDYTPADTDNASVKFDLAVPAGLNTIVLPIDLSVEEVADVFGETAKVYNFFKTDNGVAKFYLVAEVKAGVPCLIKTEEVSNVVTLNNKQISSSLIVKGDLNVKFRGTYSELAKAENQYIPSESMIAAPASESDSPVMIPAYSAYLESENAITSIELIDQVMGIDEIEDINLEDAEIYDLNGLRVVNPTPGIYVVNGKKVVIK